MRRFILLFIFILAVWSSIAVQAQEENRSGVWELWEVEINDINTTSNNFRVREIYQMRFSGTFRAGTRVIRLQNLEDIRDVRVFDGGQALVTGCDEQPGTYCVTDTDEGRSIRYIFTSPVTDGRKNIIIEYQVIGALRVYEGGDQLWWSAVPPDHPFPVEQARVVVQMPPNYSPREGVDPVVIYDAQGTVAVQNGVVTAEARNLAPDQPMSIRVQYPHNPDARVAGWQPQFDAERAEEARQEDLKAQYSPLANLSSLAGCLLFGLGAPLAVFSLWYTQGRAPKAPPVPEYLTEPPGNLPPAIAGAILTQATLPSHVLGTLIDLASRGYVDIRDEGEHSYTFYRTAKADSELHDFERDFLSDFFGGANFVTSSDVRASFWDKLQTMRERVDGILDKNKIFDSSRETLKRRWRIAGIALLLAGICGGCGLITFTPDVFAFPSMIVGLGIMFLGALLIASTFAISKLTRRGVEQIAKWKAFYTYLANIRKYQDEAQPEQFNAYFPYAVAFGIQKPWVDWFKGQPDVPAPDWYYPTYIPYTPYGAGGSPAASTSNDDVDSLFTPAANTPTSSTPEFSLESMSQNMTASLESISSDLTTMLEDTASALSGASVTRSSSWTSNSDWGSSWSSGGSDFSGGGDSGGGDSGGGSSSFD
jgi:uncharacterized membrane protein YgcG